MRRCHKTPLVWLGNRAVTDPNLADHVWKTLGISPSVFHAWVDLVYPPGSLGHSVLSARAYDNAFGTDTSRQSNTFDMGLPDFAWESYEPPATISGEPPRAQVIYLTGVPEDGRARFG